MTVVAALAALGIRSGGQVRSRTVAIAKAKAETQATYAQVELERRSLHEKQHKLDYFQQIAEVHGAAMTGFDDLNKRYGHVEPQPNKVSLRRLLVLKSGNHQSVWAYRIAVPKDYPVFLRSAVAVAESIEGRSRYDLDNQSWLEGRLLQDPRKLQIGIEPGIHSLVIKSTRVSREPKRSTIQVILDDTVLLNTNTIDPAWRSGSSSSISPQTQYDFDFQRRPSMRLVQMEFGKDKSEVDYDVWVWLSGSEAVDGFTEYRDQKTHAGGLSINE